MFMPEVYLFLYWTAISAVSVMLAVLTSSGLFFSTTGRTHAQHLTFKEKMQMLNDSGLLFLILYVFLAFFCFVIHIPEPVASAFVLAAVAKVAYNNYAFNLYRVELKKSRKKVTAGVFDILIFGLAFLLLNCLQIA